MKLIIEQRIWEYLDGSCSLEEHRDLSRLIETDPEYHYIYQELLDIKNQLSKNDLETPSMGFTKDVMRKIRVEPAPGSIKALVDTRIIYTIVLFFLTSILAGLVLLLLQIDWQAQVQENWTIQFSEMAISNAAKDWITKGFLFFDIVIALYAVDFVLRKKLIKPS